MPRRAIDDGQEGLRARLAAGAPTSVDIESASFDIVLATETPVRDLVRNLAQRDQSADDAWIEADVSLPMSAIDLSRVRGMPLVDCHDTSGGIRKVLGKIEDLRVEGDKLIARATLNKRNRDLIEDIAAGFDGNVSVGFGMSAGEIEFRPGDVPLVRASKWTPTEGSLVAVGADPNSYVRGQRSFPAPVLTVRADTPNTENTMDLEEAISAAETAVAALDEAVAAAGEGADAALLERARKVRAEAEPKKKGEGDKPAPAASEDEKAEDEAVRSVRAIAASYGLEAQVDSLRSLGTKSTDIRSAVREAVLKRGLTAGAAAPAQVKPAPRSEGQRSAAIDTNAIYARRNLRGAPAPDANKRS